MSDLRTKWVLLGSLAGVMAGYALGIWAPGFMLNTAFIGGLFLNGLKVIIAPLIVTSIVVAIAALGKNGKVGRSTLSAILYFAATTAIAVAIGLILVLVIRPGVGLASTGGFYPGFLSEFQSMTMEQFLESLIPSALPGAIVQGNYLGLVMVSIAFGLVLLKLGRRAKKISDLVQDFNQLVFTVIEWLMLALPIGLLFLVGQSVAGSPGTVGQLFNGMGSYALVVLGAFAIHALLVLPLALKIYTRRNLLETSGHLIPAFAAAFGSSSAVVALPVTTDCVVNRCRIDNRAGSYVLPLGSVLNVNATAAYAVIGTLFVAQIFGIALSVPQIILIALTAIALSFGVSAVPYSSLFIMFVLFGISGFPPEAYTGIGLILGFDWLLDRIRAVVNVWSDSVGAAIVAETFEFKTARKGALNRAKSSQRSTSLERPETPYRSRQDSRGSRPDRTRTAPDGGRGRSSDRSDSPPKPVRGRGSRSDYAPAKERSPFAIDSVEDHPVDLESRIPARDRRPDTRPRRNGSRTVERSDESRTARRPQRQSATNELNRKPPEKEVAKADSADRYSPSKPTRPIYVIPPPPPLPVMGDRQTRPAEISKEIEKEKPVVESEKISEDTASREISAVTVEEEMDDIQPTPTAVDDEYSEPDITDDQSEEQPLKSESVDEGEPTEGVETTEDEQQKEIQFGRKSKGRTVRQEEKPEPKEEPADTKEEINYKIEAQSFGRSRKKRTRK